MSIQRAMVNCDECSRYIHKGGEDEERGMAYRNEAMKALESVAAEGLSTSEQDARERSAITDALDACENCGVNDIERTIYSVISDYRDQKA